MQISKKKRDILIIIVALIIILIILGLFFFWPEEENNVPTESGEGPGDFSITGNIIENKKEGLKFIIPDGWQAEIPEQIFEQDWGVNILSPDSEISVYVPPDSYLIDKGCVISVNIEKSPTFFNAISNYLSNVSQSTRISSFNDKEDTGIMRIDGHLAWKELSFDREDVGKRLELIIPLQDNKLIYLSFISSDSEKDYCFEEFNKFLEKISINR